MLKNGIHKDFFIVCRVASEAVTTKTSQHVANTPVVAAEGSSDAKGQGGTQLLHAMVGSLSAA